MPRIAVVGHIEWVDFLQLERLPGRGEIRPATRLRRNTAGGAVVAAAVLAQLAATVDLFSATGDDELGATAQAELKQWGITPHIALRTQPTREAITLFDATHERSIITIGERLRPAGDDDLPWELLRQADGVYFTAGDLGALQHARQAKVLTATPRISENLEVPALRLDALIYSAQDATEQRWAQLLKPHANYVVETTGASGGHWSGKTSGSWEPAPLPGPVIDSYGAGDSFAGGFTYGLASTGDPRQAALLGAECAARMLTRAGAP